MKVLVISFLFIFISCGKSQYDQVSENDEGIPINDSAILTSPDEEVEQDLPQLQKDQYSAFGISSQENSGITSRGEWCVGTNPKRMHEFKCGFGNPGAGWVLQPDGCYHKRTDRPCSCTVSNDFDTWYSRAFKECRGTTYYIRDNCGDEKYVTNFPECTGGNNDGSINTNSRSEVVSAYNNRARAATPAMEWTGNISECKAGTTSIAYQQRIIDQINFYRAMTGMPLAILSPNIERYQEAALMMDANNSLSHNPPSTWRCYSSSGASGAGSANLALGANGPRAIDLYINDPGANNTAVGHRRWLLHPSRKSFATGDVPGANALATFLSGSNSHNVEYYTWPSQGYFPYQILPSSNRWSFSMGSASFNEAEVSMKNKTTGENYSVSIEPLRSGYGWNTIVFKPSGLSRSRPQRDTVIEVEIKKVKVSREYKTYRYEVIIINTNS